MIFSPRLVAKPTSVPCQPISPAIPFVIIVSFSGLSSGTRSISMGLVFVWKA